MLLVNSKFQSFEELSLENSATIELPEERLSTCRVVAVSNRLSEVPAPKKKLLRDLGLMT
jgi:hypothetical protein